MWPFLNPAYNFSFRFTLPEPPHFISPAHWSSLGSVVFLRMERSKRLPAQGRWTESSGKGADGWDLTMLAVLRSAVFLLQYEADEQSHTRCPRLNAAGALLLSLSYTRMPLSVGVACLTLPPSLPRSLSSRGALHSLTCQPSLYLISQDTVYLNVITTATYTQHTCPSIVCPPFLGKILPQDFLEPLLA